MKKQHENLKDMPDQYWRDKLSAEQFEVCRAKGTERPFCGLYSEFKEEGIYSCLCCGQDLFSSEAKFDSGTGWPSFWESVSSASIELQEDRSLYPRIRTEVLCSKCGAHLGHVFDDGPPPTYKRYCINSICLVHSR